MQAGVYIETAEKNKAFVSLYHEEVANLISNYVGSQDTLLDIGTGEITTLSGVAQNLKTKPLHIFAFDISWSRIYKGIEYASKHMGECFNHFTPFVADISEIPFLDKSINVTISSHALEPNGSRLPELLSELFRITRDKVILFEPFYEINTDEGKERMDRLGYIKGMEAAVEACGGKLLDKIKIKNVFNPLNPTGCFIIQPPTQEIMQPLSQGPTSIFSVPGTNYSLERIDDFFFSKTTGFCFPILKSIPVLKSKTAILASVLCKD